MIVLLMKFGADPTYKDGEGCNCLHLAAQLGHTAIAAYLVAKGCDVNGPDANGMSPVMWSCFRSTSGVDPTRLLLRVRYYVQSFYTTYKPKGVKKPLELTSF